MLASAKTVAFYPPDVCLNDKDQGTRSRSIVQRCGVVLSQLERDAERAGYEVVSWVNLRGNNRPIEYAREAHVDVLFEINEMLPQEVSDSDIHKTLTFFSRDDNSADKDLGVSTGVAERCHRWATRDQKITPGLNSTLDIKTVSVVDGRARWHYRKSVSQATGQEFPKVAFVGTTKPSQTGQRFLGVGLGVALSGVIFALVDNSVNSGTDPVTGAPKMKVFGDAPLYMIGLGAVVAVVGVGIMVSTGQAQPEPNDVLCLEDHLPKDTMKQPSEGPVSSEHHFDEATAAADPLAKEEERLALQRAKEFFTIVSDAHQSAPAAPAPPPAAPAPATPAPPAH